MVSYHPNTGLLAAAGFFFFGSVGAAIGWAVEEFTGAAMYL